MPDNFLETKRSEKGGIRHWFRCTHIFCKSEFSISDKDKMWREVEGKPMPLYCRTHALERVDKTAKQIASPFFAVLPRGSQANIYNRKKWRRPKPV